MQYLRDDTLLTQDERKELEPFEFSLSIDGSDNDDSDAENLSDGDYGVDILRRHHKRQRVEKKYIDIAAIPVTSNIVERFFSQVKLNLTYLRNSLLPSTLETIMF